MKPSDLMLIIFVSLFCSVALYFIYNIIADAKESVDSQLQNNDFMSECNCIQVLSSSNDSIVIENIGCDYIFDLKIIFPDSNYSYQKTIKKYEVVQFFFNSSFKDEYRFVYNGCE